MLLAGCCCVQFHPLGPRTACHDCAPWLQEERPWEWNKPCSYLEVWSEVLYMRLKCYSDQGNSAPILVKAAIALLNSGVVYIKFWYRINLHWNYTGSQLWSDSCRVMLLSCVGKKPNRTLQMVVNKQVILCSAWSHYKLHLWRWKLELVEWC